MPVIEGLFAFDVTPQTLAVGAADQLSTNVYNAGSALRKFSGLSPKPPFLVSNYVITAGTGALSWRVRFVGADNAALTTNPEIIVDSGVQLRENVTGTEAALAIGSRITYAMSLRGQRMAKQYYGAIYTQGTADQQGKVSCYVTETPQTNMPYAKAAVP